MTIPEKARLYMELSKVRHRLERNEREIEEEKANIKAGVADALDYVAEVRGHLEGELKSLIEELSISQLKFGDEDEIISILDFYDPKDSEKLFLECNILFYDNYEMQEADYYLHIDLEKKSLVEAALNRGVISPKFMLLIKKCVTSIVKEVQTEKYQKLFKNGKGNEYLPGCLKECLEDEED